MHALSNDDFDGVCFSWLFCALILKTLSMKYARTWVFRRMFGHLDLAWMLHAIKQSIECGGKLGQMRVDGVSWIHETHTLLRQSESLTHNFNWNALSGTGAVCASWVQWTLRPPGRWILIQTWPIYFGLTKLCGFRQLIHFLMCTYTHTHLGQHHIVRLVQRGHNAILS